MLVILACQACMALASDSATLQAQLDSLVSPVLLLNAGAQYKLTSALNLTSTLLRLGALRIDGGKGATLVGTGASQLLHATIPPSSPHFGNTTLELASLTLRGGHTKAGGRGGALHAAGLRSLTVLGCTFEQNGADLGTANIAAARHALGGDDVPLGGGALAVEDVPRVRVSGSSFARNFAATVISNSTSGGWSELGAYGVAGGAVLVFFSERAAALAPIDISFEGCAFDSNSLHGSAGAGMSSGTLWGGAVAVKFARTLWLRAATIAVRASNFSANEVDASSTLVAVAGAFGVHVNGNVSGLAVTVTGGCRFVNNSAAGYSADGGALVVSTGGPVYLAQQRTSRNLSLAVTDALFEQNDVESQASGVSNDAGGFTVATATGGALLQSFFGNIFDSTTIVRDTRFVRNNAVGHVVFGGAAYMYFNAPPKNLVFGDVGFSPKYPNLTIPTIENTAVDFTGCAFERNGLYTARSAALSGGQAGGGGAVGIIKLTDPTRWSTGYAHGESLYPRWVPAEITNATFTSSTFLDNAADCASCSGGALMLLGVAAFLNGVSVLRNNASVMGGGIQLQGLTTSIVLSNSTLSANEAFEESFGNQLHSQAQGGISFLSGTAVQMNEPHPRRVTDQVVYSAFQKRYIDFAVGDTSVVASGLSHGIVAPRTGRVIVSADSSFSCGSGSELHWANVNHVEFETFPWNFLMRFTTLRATCAACPQRTYALDRGQRRGAHVTQHVQCYDCPLGGNCQRGGAAVQPLPGWWGYIEQGAAGAGSGGAGAGSGTNSTPVLKFQQCPPGYCCPVGARDGECSTYDYCAQNRTGPLCGRCRAGFSTVLGGSSCVPDSHCVPGAFFGVVAACGVLFLVALVWYALWAYREMVEQGGRPAGFARIVVYFFQVAALILPENDNAAAALVFGLLNMRSSSGGSGGICPVVGLDAVSKEFLGVALLFIALVVLAAASCVVAPPAAAAARAQAGGGGSGGGGSALRVCRDAVRCTRFAYDPFPLAIQILLFMSYSGMLEICFRLCKCEELGPFGNVLFIDGSYQCYTWWQSAILVPLCVLLSFVPLVLEWRRRAWEHIVATSENPSDTTVVQLHYLTGPFTPEYSWWASVVLGFRLWLTFGYTFITSPFDRSMYMALSCSAFALASAWARPFRVGAAQVSDQICLFSLVVIATLNVQVVNASGEVWRASRSQGTTLVFFFLAPIATLAAWVRHKFARFAALGAARVRRN
eukprot:g6504.t1